MSINLSLKQLRQASFITRCRSVFRRHEVSPTCFELEITETTLMADPKRTIKLLDELYAMGLHLSIDDFGTGYSSLSALQQFPIGTLKIDQSFVRDAAVNSDDATIVRTIIDMGKALEVEVVAEGVENEEQFNFLRGRGCHYAQGRLFGDAMSADEFLALLLAQAERPRQGQPAVRLLGLGAAGQAVSLTSEPAASTITAPSLDSPADNPRPCSLSPPSSLRRGTRLLISDASFTIYRGEKVGIVGANGCGKSSLLALMLGELQPDAGSFDMPSQLVVAHVAQELDATEQRGHRVRDGRRCRAARDRSGDRRRPKRATPAQRSASCTPATPRSAATTRAAAPARLMHGLGFSAADETRPVRAFSGGWRVRLNVAQALMCRSDLLLLDEPTNHLDLDAVLWLEDWLRDYPRHAADDRARPRVPRSHRRSHRAHRARRGAALHAATTPRSKSSAPRSSRSSSRCTSASSARSST